MAGPTNMISGMMNDPLNQAQSAINAMATETEEEKKKRLAQMQGIKAAGSSVASPISSLFNSAGNQY